MDGRQKPAGPPCQSLPNKPPPLPRLFVFALSLVSIALIREITNLGSYICTRLGWGVGMFAPIASALVSLASAVALVWLLMRLTSIASNLTNNIPGPRFAKITRLWKFSHMIKGTYKQQLRQLHVQHGPLIQIGPREYSIDNPGLLWRCNLQKTSAPYASLHRPVPSQSAPILADVYNMANIFRREADLEACNDALMALLHAFSSSGEEFDVAELIARYAYDVMFATTASQSPHFLQKPIDAAKVAKALEDWELHAALSDGHFRLQPLLAKIARLFRVTDLQEVVGEHLNAMEAPSRDMQEACIALLLAGSDPVIVHLVSSLWYIYRDPELLQRLRDEMDSVGLAEQPKIKDLIHAKASMPLLHAVLQESLRLHLPADSRAIKYLVPDAGVQILNFHDIPSGCTICLEPSVAHVNPSIFGADAHTFSESRWLGERFRSLRPHCATFGSSINNCPGEDLHTSILSKILTQVIPTFDITMSSTNTNITIPAASFVSPKEHIVSGLKLSTDVAPSNTPNNTPIRATAPAFKKCLPPHLKAVAAARSASVASTDSSTSSTATVKSTVSTASTTGTTATTKSYTTPISWKDQATLENALGCDITAKLLARLDPSKPLVCGPPFVTKPIESSRDRAITHKILERVWDGRLVHETEFKTSNMYIWVRGSRVPNWLQRLHDNRSKNPVHKGNDNAVNKGDNNAVNKGNENRHSVTKLAPHKSGKPLTSQYPAHKLAAMRAAGIIPSTAPTGAFAKARAGDAVPKDDAKAAELRQLFRKNMDAHEAQVKKAKEAADAAGPQVFTGHTFKEKFIMNRHAVAAKEVEVDEPKRTTASIPPHLRKKMMMEAAAAKEAEASKDTTWVAAKLPTPFASE